MNESDLAGDLRAICDEKGRETDSAKAAQIFHQLGLIYGSRTANRQNFIYSVALLNSALNRKPENVSEIHYDLQQVCSRVLRESNSIIQDEDLTAVSRNLLIQHVKPMRLWAKRAVEKMPANIPWEASGAGLRDRETEKVAAVRKLQDEVTAQYQDLMNTISDHCIRILGAPPCKFSHVGMGSLARKEITPYSDFENIIVLEDGVEKSNDYTAMQEYFRWYSVIFLVILINLGETILRCVSVPCLSDKNGRSWFYDIQPRGICFDSFETHASKTPFGKQRATESNPWTTELIKPVTEMLRYMETEEDLKNGYNLADLLTKTCFVAGDIEVYRCFEANAKEKMAQLNFGLSHPRQVKKLKENIENWELIQNMIDATVSTGLFNVKQVIYRSVTILIPLLGRVFAARSNSCFDIIEELLTNSVISFEQANELLYAVAVACEVRIKTYLHLGGQEDFISTTRPMEKEVKNGVFTPYTHDANEPLDVMTALGTRSVYDFFRIASSFYLWLNQEDKEDAQIKIIIPKTSTKEVPIHQKINIMFILHLFEHLLVEWEAWKETGQKDGYYGFIMQIAGRTKFLQGQYKEAIDIFQTVINSAIGVKDWQLVPFDFMHLCLSDQAASYQKLGDLNKALLLYNKADNMLANCNLDFNIPGRQDEKVFMHNHYKVPLLRNNNLLLKGECLMQMRRFSEAKTIFSALLNDRNVKSKVVLKKRVLLGYKDCLLMRGEHQELVQYDVANLIELQNTIEPDPVAVADCHAQIGFTCHKLGRNEEALEHYLLEYSLIEDNPKKAFMCNLNIVITALHCGRISDGLAQLQCFIKRRTRRLVNMGDTGNLHPNPQCAKLIEKMLQVYKVYKRSGERMLIESVISSALLFYQRNSGALLAVTDTIQLLELLSISHLEVEKYNEAKHWLIEEICYRTTRYHQDKSQNLALMRNIYNLGHCLFIERDYEEAFYCFRCVKSLSTRRHGPKPERIVSRSKFGAAVCKLLLR